MNRIRELRDDKNMTQNDLAAAMNCTKVTISRYETGQHEIDSATINRLCDIFDCTADYLLCRSDNPSPLISAEDLRLLQAYRAAPEHIRTAIAAMLQLDEKETPAAQKERAAG